MHSSLPKLISQATHSVFLKRTKSDVQTSQLHRATVLFYLILDRLSPPLEGWELTYVVSKVLNKAGIVIPTLQKGKLRLKRSVI